MISLDELLKRAGLPEIGQPEHISGLAYDSRQAQPGSLFVAIPGFHVDGHDFAAAAVAGGAVAVVAQKPLPLPVPVLVVENSRAALSSLAAAWYDFPARQLRIAGITGTDGKTTTTTMIWSAWRAAGQRAASMSTVDWRLGDEVTPNKLRQTTTEALEIQAQLRRVVDSGCSHCAIETSSHALHLARVESIDYQIAVYTKITSEHLELHGSREAYLNAKAHLLDLLVRDGVAVLDIDDHWATPVLQKRSAVETVTYSAGGDNTADVVATGIEVSPQGTRFTVQTPWGNDAVHLRLAGRFNVANTLAAISAVAATGTPLAPAIAGIEALDRVPGRMERVDLGQPFAVVIDYAHTAEALAKVLSELRAATSARLWVLFGSAGERDREKRPAMGRTAAELADMIVVTDEDPRSEDRQLILDEIAAGAGEAGAEMNRNLFVIPDRAEAIDFAIRHAGAGDTLLCAGKGHETTMFTNAGTVPWDERATVNAALAALCK